MIDAERFVIFLALVIVIGAALQLSGWLIRRIFPHADRPPDMMIEDMRQMINSLRVHVSELEDELYELSRALNECRRETQDLEIENAVLAERLRNVSMPVAGRTLIVKATEAYGRQLREEYDACSRQLGTTLEEADKVRLKRRMKEIEGEIGRLGGTASG